MLLTYDDLKNEVCQSLNLSLTPDIENRLKANVRRVLLSLIMENPESELYDSTSLAIDSTTDEYTFTEAVTNIIGVYCDSSEVVYRSFRRFQQEVNQGGADTTSDKPMYWTIAGKSNQNFLKIKIYPKPSSATTLTIYYIPPINPMGLERFPETWTNALIEGVKKLMGKTVEERMEARQSYKENREQLQKNLFPVTPNVDPIQLDPEWENTILDINNLR